MMDDFSTYETFAEAFLTFTQLCRSHDLKVGINENMEALSSAAFGLMNKRQPFKYALKSIFCTSEEESKIFDGLFTQFWGTDGTFIKSKTTYKNRSNLNKKNKAKSSLVMMGLGKEENEALTEAKNTSGASKSATLRNTDFAKVKSMDSALLEELAMQLWHQMSLRIKRQYKKGKKGSVDIQSTIRRNLSRGGNLLNLVRRQKKLQKYKLVVLLDVSGSMDKYSLFLLKFIYALKTNFRQMEAFIFSTKLEQITSFLQHKNIDESLYELSSYAKNWSGGTKIGACLQAFNEQYAKRVLHGKTLTIILSDGLDTGEPNDLFKELNYIKMRTKKLVWLNPLKGMQGYQPIQRGMEAALPTLHYFEAAHNINSLLNLEKIIQDA